MRRAGPARSTARDPAHAHAYLLSAQWRRPLGTLRRSAARAPPRARGVRAARSSVYLSVVPWPAAAIGTAARRLNAERALPQGACCLGRLPRAPTVCGSKCAWLAGPGPRACGAKRGRKVLFMSPKSPSAWLVPTAGWHGRRADGLRSGPGGMAAPKRRPAWPRPGRPPTYGDAYVLSLPRARAARIPSSVHHIATGSTQHVKIVEQSSLVTV
mmetsp:Transcript_21915/g.73709  ORF Transcript_21915/g.73709 Transcript_21915/m.73709 type:complete len:213 (-) Transcript_21915:10-648(-)